MGAIALQAGAVPAQGLGDPADAIRKALRKGLTSLAVAFTNAGADIITNRVIQAGTAPKNIGWGIGTGGAAVGNTALGTESAPTTAGGRTVGTESRTTGSVTNDQYTVTGTVTAGSTLAITEAGLFDNVTAGNMLIRADFSAVNVVSGDSIAFTFNLRFVPSAA
jgi:hypothetical protein